VPDEAYESVCRHFSEGEVIALSVAVANINAWNRLGAAFRFAPPIPKQASESKAA
jgi:alkylhydroperoxidase family enzyme